MIKIDYLTYYRYNTQLDWICSDSFDCHKLAKKYLSLELKDLRRMNQRKPFDLDVVEICGKIDKRTTTTKVEQEVFDGKII